MIRMIESEIYFDLLVKEDNDVVERYVIFCHMKLNKQGTVDFRYYEQDLRLSPRLVESIFDKIDDPDIAEFVIDKEEFDSIKEFDSIYADLSLVTGTNEQINQKVRATEAYKQFYDAMNKNRNRRKPRDITPQKKM